MQPLEPTLAETSGPSLVSSRFGETRWSLVGRAGHEDAEVRHDAMAAILRRYLSPLRSYLVVRKRIDPHRADDLLQEFIADKVLGTGILSKAVRERGKFRTFLVVALDRFVLNQIRDQNAAKRVPENGFVSLPDEPAVSDDGSGPGREFDTEWARTVLEDALARMRETCRRAGRNDLWNVFRDRVVGPALEDTEPSSYADLAEQYSFRSPAEAANVVLTGKRMLIRFLREVVGECARDEAEVDEEIRDLRRILAGGAEYRTN
jgi:DNA-directed RNA polymerase specialized sigma24 family protein